MTDQQLPEALTHLVSEIDSWGRGNLWPMAPDMSGERRLLRPSTVRLVAAYDEARAALSAHRAEGERACATCGRYDLDLGVDPDDGEVFCEIPMAWIPARVGCPWWCPPMDGFDDWTPKEASDE